MSRSRAHLTLKSWIAVLLRHAGLRRIAAAQRSAAAQSLNRGLCLATLFALLALAGCGTSTPTLPVRQETPAEAHIATRTAVQTKTPAEPVPATSPAPTLGVEPAELKGISIEFWHPWSGAAGEAIQASVAAFNAANQYGIQAQAIYRGNFNDLYEAVDAALESGDPPALTAGHTYQIAGWATGEAVVDLNAYVDDPRWGLSRDEQAGFYPVFWEQDLQEGKRLGLPAQRSALVMVYNQTWARQLGYSEPPGTPAEFREQACAAAQANRLDAAAENDGSGGWAIDTSYSALLSWLYAFGSQPIIPEGKGYNFNTPQSEDALAFLKDLLDAGCAFELRGDLPETGFASRQALMVTLPIVDLPDLQAELQRADSADQWTVLGFPEPGGQPALSVYGPSFVAFETSSQEQLAAWLLVKWLSAPQQEAAFVAAAGGFPTQAATLGYLGDYAAQHPGWAAALDLLPAAQAEPGLASWSDVRWVVGDVATQIFRYYFTPDRIPATLMLMDETAAELHSRSP